MDCPRCGRAMVLRRVMEGRDGLKAVIYEWSCRSYGLRNVIQAVRIYRVDGTLRVVDVTRAVIGELRANEALTNLRALPP